MEEEKNLNEKNKRRVQSTEAFVEIDSNASIEQKISQHEDVALKIAAQFSKDEILPFF